MKQIIMALLTLLAVSCHVGPRLEHIPAFHNPAGAEVTVNIEVNEPEYRRDRFKGELLEVDSSDGLLVAVRTETDVEPQLMWFRWNVVHEVNAIRIPSVGKKLWVPGVSEFDVMDDLRLVARYPQGLDQSLRARLLAAYNQPSFGVVADGVE